MPDDLRKMASSLAVPAARLTPFHRVFVAARLLRRTLPVLGNHKFEDLHYCLHAFRRVCESGMRCREGTSLQSLFAYTWDDGLRDERQRLAVRVARYCVTWLMELEDWRNAKADDTANRFEVWLMLARAVAADAVEAARAAVAEDLTVLLSTGDHLAATGHYLTLNGLGPLWPAGWPADWPEDDRLDTASAFARFSGFRGLHPINTDYPFRRRRRRRSCCLRGCRRAPSSWAMVSRGGSGPQFEWANWFGRRPSFHRPRMSACCAPCIPPWTTCGQTSGFSSRSSPRFGEAFAPTAPPHRQNN
jgi:hypothetical protein